MRYYKIKFTNPATNAAVLPLSLNGMEISSLTSAGQWNPAALNVEFDIPQAPMHSTDGNAFLKIWGLGLRDIGSAFNLNGMNVEVSAGMSKGLPLANPQQAGVLMKASVLNAFGNWVGTEQSIDMTFAPSVGTPLAPKNFVLNWVSGQPLATALASTLKAALPDAKQNIKLSPRLVLNHDQPGIYGTLQELAGYLQPFSQTVVTDAGYPGVQITYDGTTVSAVDQTTPPPVKEIAFQDLLGQPTWRAPLLIQAKVVMRADLNLQDVVKLPPGLTTNTQAAITRFQDKTAFTGNFVVQTIHHYGNFRQADAASWNTTLDLTPEVKST